MQLRTRIDGGGTRPLDAWGVDSEYGTLRDVLIGPIDHFTWQPGNAVCQRAERIGLRFDFAVARREGLSLPSGSCVSWTCGSLRRIEIISGNGLAITLPDLYIPAW